jgi:uncharacterized membrane protein YcaP (DUF421 family)
MLLVFIRSLILYVLVLFVMRMMGKREIGQLQPFELAISIMIADLAATPMATPRNPYILWRYSDYCIAYNTFTYFIFKYAKFEGKRIYLWKAINLNL